MKRGDIYVAHLTPRSGSEQRGVRPVIVVSHDAFNETPGWRSVIVVPLSNSGSRTHRGPTAVPVPRGASELRSDSIALCHQVTTLDRMKLTRRLGALSPAQMLLIEKGLKAAQGLA
jgi:mRNA interferase MazF